MTDDEEYYEVVAGSNSQSEPEENEQTSLPTKLIIHQDYDEETYANDIAMIKVDPPFEFTPQVDFAILPPRGYVPKGRYQICGWGRTQEDGPASDIVLKLEVPAISDDECKRKLEEYEIIDSMMCAGGESGKDACQGGSTSFHMYNRNVCTIR